jgi:hypothetical protein
MPIIRPEGISGKSSAPRATAAKVATKPQTSTKGKFQGYPWQWPVGPDDESLWTTTVAGRPDLTELKQQLLRHGGTGFQRNDYLVKFFDRKICEKLRARGTFVDGRGAIVYPMVASECEMNSILLAITRKFEFLTCMELSDDGVWRVHYWCVTPDGRIVETTCARELYFGTRIRVPWTYVVGFRTLFRCLSASHPLWKRIPTSYPLHPANRKNGRGEN